MIRFLCSSDALDALDALGASYTLTRPKQGLLMYQGVFFKTPA